MENFRYVQISVRYFFSKSDYFKNILFKNFRYYGKSEN